MPLRKTSALLLVSIFYFFNTYSFAQTDPATATCANNLKGVVQPTPESIQQAWVDLVLKRRESVNYDLHELQAFAESNGFEILVLRHPTEGHPLGVTVSKGPSVKQQPPKRFWNE